MTSQTDNSGRFSKGIVPWNKGLRGYMGANVTSFSRESVNALGARSVGVPRASKDQFVCLVEERRRGVDARTGKVYMFRKRRSYARVLMEGVLGRPLAKDEIVWHINGDAFDNTPNNLEVITRKELARRNKGKHIGKEGNEP